MEFASFFNSLGTKVTIVEMLPEILGGLDFEISAMLRDIYAKKGIDFHLNAKVVQVDGHKVVFEKEGKTQTVEGEKILLSVRPSSCDTRIWIGKSERGTEQRRHQDRRKNAHECARSFCSRGMLQVFRCWLIRQVAKGKWWSIILSDVRTGCVTMPFPAWFTPIPK